MNYTGLAIWLARSCLASPGSSGYGSAVAFWAKYKARILGAGLDGWRYAVVAFLLLSMAAVPVKMALRLVLDVKYVWVTPWFNI